MAVNRQLRGVVGGGGVVVESRTVPFTSTFTTSGIIADAAKEPDHEVTERSLNRASNTLPQCVAPSPQIQPQCFASSLQIQAQCVACRLSCLVLFSSRREGKFSFCSVILKVHMK